MKLSKRLTPLLTLALGFLGVVVCAVGIAATWYIGSRLSRTSDRVLDGIDKSLVVVRDRVVSTQRHVQELKITTEDIGKGLRNWAREETSEHLASRLAIREKAEQLALGLGQADGWLEMSEAMIEGVQQAFLLGKSIGAPVDAAAMEPLLEKLGVLRSDLKEASRTVEEIRDRAAEIAEGESLKERIEQAAQLALRVVMTLSNIDSRLSESAAGLSEMQTDVQRLKSKTHDLLIIAQIAVFLLMVWMALGQVCLCRRSWEKHRRVRAAI